MPKLTQRQIARAVAGKRQYIQEDNVHMFSNHGQVKWIVVDQFADRFMYDAVLQSTGHDLALGNHQDPNVTYRIDRPRAHYHFRNVSNHACYMNIFVCTYRENLPFDSTDQTSQIKKFVINQLVTGWDDLMQAAQVTNAGTGTVVDYTQDEIYCSSTVKYLSPFHSKPFTQKFIVENQIGGRFEPGQDYHLDVSAKGHDWIYRAQTPAQSSTSVEGYRKKSKFILVSLHGVLGKGVDDDTKIGWMSTDIGVEITHKASVFKLNLSDDTLAVIDSHDAVPVSGFEGPQYIASMAQDDA